MDYRSSLPFPECAQPSLDAIFTGLTFNGSRDREVVRVINELCFYQSQISQRPLDRQDPDKRVRQLLGLAPKQGLPEKIAKFMRDEWSRICDIRLQGPYVAIRLLLASGVAHSPQERKVLLPVKASSEETRRRVYSHLANQIVEAINATREEYQNLVNPDRHIQRYSEMHEALARQLGVRVTIGKDDRISSLRASLLEARGEFQKAKELYQAAPHSGDNKDIERRLRNAQNKVNALTSELQKQLSSSK